MHLNFYVQRLWPVTWILTTAQHHQDVCCPCIGAWPDDISEFSCSHAHAAGGKCVNITIAGKTWEYQADYGLQCGVHKEPGNPDCWDLETGMERTGSDRKEWCDRSWCYIDPCDCNAWDSVESHYFPEQTYYSYAACGSADTYSLTHEPAKCSDRSFINGKCSKDSVISASAQLCPRLLFATCIVLLVRISS
eukprot:TRINITY_DN11754_c0_g1_i2.p1 TRINITY_DN11754_c0_g1~~TRINITY_DN11754_c0_g1_i2.p1  ORF type:complete len:192 (-),score=16.59 TRINITY_DN11754_c0_g1_i2:21-596(-)